MTHHDFNPIIVMFNVVEHLENKLIPDIVYIIEAINSFPTSSNSFCIYLEYNNTKKHLFMVQKNVNVFFFIWKS